MYNTFLVALLASSIHIGNCDAVAENVGMEAVLSQDDQCTAGGCALNALQVQAGTTRKSDACSTGVVAVMKRFAPKCIRDCPAMCQPLANAAHAFLAGGAEAVNVVVCANQEELHCAFEHYGDCKTLVRLASHVGLVLPSSSEEMTAQCEPGARQAAEEEEELVGDEDEGGQCHRGLVGKMYKLYHECFDACPDMCAPVQKAAIAMIFGGGLTAAKHVVCRYQDNFACPMKQENKVKCAAIVEKAQGFGVVLPDTPEELAEQCRLLD